MAYPVSIDSDGLALAGHFQAISDRHPTRNALVVCHGYPNKGRDANLSGKSFPQLVDRLSTALEWDALTVNFRGCGESDGDFSMDGWRADVHAAVGFLTARENQRVWLVGFGTGGSLCVVAGADNESVAGVAACSSPADFDDWADRPRRMVAHSQNVGVIRDPEFPPDLEEWAKGFQRVKATDGAAKLAPRPLLVLHGNADDIIPSMDALAIADAHGRAELRLLSGGGHELRHDPRAIAVLIGWLRRAATFEDWD